MGSMSVESFRELMIDIINSEFEIKAKPVDMKGINDTTSYNIVLYDSIACDNVINIDSIYTRYTEGESITSLVNCVKDRVKSVQTVLCSDELNEIIHDYSKVSDRIVCRLLNYEWNKEYIKDKPYVKMGNFVVVFSVLSSYDDSKIAMANITNNLQREWHITVRELFNSAIQNTMKLLPPKLTEQTSLTEEDNGVLFYMSNQIGIYGAAALIYPGCLANIANKLDTNLLIIFPCSVHEVIILKLSKDVEVNVEHFKNLPKELNTIFVPEKDRLGENILLYDAKEDYLTEL